jgi:hypothetical protein
MATDIQVRAVDDALAEAAKARARSTDRSLSAYVRDLIRDDLTRAEAHRRNREVLAEIAADPNRPRLSREQVDAALADARRDLDVS